MAHGYDRPALRGEDFVLPAGSVLTRLPAIGLGLALVGGLATAFLASRDATQFYFSWLVSFLFFLSLALGALYFALIHTVMQGGWGILVRRIAEIVMATLPLFALLFLPILAGRASLYHWSAPGAADHDALLQWKAPFLNTGFFLFRSGLYLVVWSAIALLFFRASRRQDSSGDLGISARLRRWSGPAVIVMALTQTFAAIDWIMSLEPHWYSTIFGLYWFAGTLVSFFAFLAVCALVLDRAGAFRDLFHAGHRHDIGKLVFAFTAFWAYIAFSQFFLIWYANLPEETVWYQHRLEGSWKSIATLLLVGHFVIPFFLFIGRTTKRQPTVLLAGSLWVLFMHWMDIHWLVMPVHARHGFSPTALDVTTLLTVGGLFLAALGWVARWQALIPVKDPRLPESLSLDRA